MKRLFHWGLCGALLLSPGLVFGQDMQTERAKVSIDGDSSEEGRAMRAFEERWASQGDAWFEDGDYWLVIQSLEMHVAWRPQSYELVTNLGWMYGNIEDETNSLRVYVSYRKRYPENAEAAYPEAQFYFFKRAYPQVIHLLEPTLSMTPKPHPNSYRILANAYRRSGLLKDALRVYELLLELTPNDEAAKRNRDSVMREIQGGG